jgi:3-hydroxymyristoyl/3-hydroxydecanoyl-(acyl carrier protein) dehydratase
MAGSLPHRSPVVLLDEIVERVAGERASARRLVSGLDPLLRDDGRLTEVMLVEAMAQCAGVAAAAGVDPVMGVLVGIDGFRCWGVVSPGDSLQIDARVLKRMGGMVKARATVRLGGEPRAEADLILKLESR